MKKIDVGAESFAELLSQRFTRRGLLEAGLVLAPLAIAGCRSAPADASAAGTLGFAPIAGSDADAIELPPGYVHDVVLRWGDSLFADTPDLDTAALPEIGRAHV